MSKLTDHLQSSIVFAGPLEGRPVIHLWEDKRMPQRPAVEMTLQQACNALVKHHIVTTIPDRMIAILAEELGEVAKEALALMRKGVGDKETVLQNMRTELCQLAAYALLQVQNIDNGEFDDYIRHRRK